MTANETPQPEKALMARPPDPAGPPPGLLYRILQHRFLLVSLLVILFLGGLFAWEYVHRGENPEQLLEAVVAGAPSGEHKAPVTPQPQEEKPPAATPSAWTSLHSSGDSDRTPGESPQRRNLRHGPDQDHR